VLAPSQTYSLTMDPLSTTQPGDRYLVHHIEGDWALVVRELDPPDAEQWIQIDGNVEIVVG
jgi:hypothetical protein